MQGYTDEEDFCDDNEAVDGDVWLGAIEARIWVVLGEMGWEMVDKLL
jgi:hypothetical protein